jgi:aryl-alcohol dehydrogenase-like predicted oxidoreductase
MDSRRLGNTGLSLFPLGLGTVKIGRNRDVKYPRAFELPSDAEVERLLDTALAEGVTLWDTAPAYGRAEERLGPFVARHRARLLLCGKAGESFDDAGSTHDFRAEAIVQSVEQSLVRLRTDHLDLLLLHSDGRDTEILEQTDALEGLQRLRSAGKIRFAGMSAKTERGIDAAGASLDVVMAPYSAARPEHAEALRRVAARGCGVLAIKVLDQGHRADAVRESLHHALGQEFVHAVVLGTSSATHLAEAARHVREFAVGER